MKGINNNTENSCFGEHNEVISTLYKLGWYRTNKNGTTLYNPEGKEIASNWRSKDLNNSLPNIPEVVSALQTAGYEIN